MKEFIYYPDVHGVGIVYLVVFEQIEKVLNE